MAYSLSHPLRCALYARVSTLNHQQDPQLQLRELRDYAERRGWQIAGEYVDAGISGAKDSRPELNRLMADAHRRRFDIVCVWKFDRFARSVSHLLRALETFKALTYREYKNQFRSARTILLFACNSKKELGKSAQLILDPQDVSTGACRPTHRMS